MAFVIENYPSQEEIDRFKATVCNLDDLPDPNKAFGGGWQPWIIDRERNVLFVHIGGGGRENFHNEYYSLFFEGYLLKPICTRYYDRKNFHAHYFDFHQWLMRRSSALAPNYRNYAFQIPEAIQHRIPEIKQCLTEALDKNLERLFLKGIMGTTLYKSTVHFDESTVDPAWYPIDKTY